jgi:threonine aldolase
MRQAGVLAAAGLYALDNNLDRLAEDHARARALAGALAECPRVAVDVSEVETNIVRVRLVRDESAQGVVDELAAAGLLCITLDRRTLRFVTHLDIDDEALGRAGEIAARVLT